MLTQGKKQARKAPKKGSSHTKKTKKVKAKSQQSSSSKRPKMQQKFIFVTGGVISSIGKGLTAASLGALMEARGLKTTLMKCDPYINVDPGTMSPFQHGEVYVTEDGAETDLDLGHYERFTSLSVKRSNSLTAGQVYESVLANERKGKYLGGTVQVIPHITNEIKKRIHEAAQGYDVTIVEIGGTIGDIEGLPFIEAIRQMRVDLGYNNTTFVHVTYVPYISTVNELKSKPTQHSVKELREVGIQPDLLVCRSEKPMNNELREKIGLFCSVKSENVISAVDSKTIYEVPVNLNSEKFDEKICNHLGIVSDSPNIIGWKKIVRRIKGPNHEVSIALVGKYVDSKESYKSLNEAIMHGGIANKSKVNFHYIDSSQLKARNVKKILSHVDGILVPGGFGVRGANGKMIAIQYARENKIPFLGICFGMQLACIEFAKNVCGIKRASSHEIVGDKGKPKDLIINYMEEQRFIDRVGGTMRLGSYPCHLVKGSQAANIYDTPLIHERHRHRYEFNNKFKLQLKNHGMEVSGICKERNLVEIVEITDHPWFIGVQFHPEFKSKPMEPHPLFISFIKAALKQYSHKSSHKNINKQRSTKKNVSLSPPLSSHNSPITHGKPLNA